MSLEICCWKQSVYRVMGVGRRRPRKFWRPFFRDHTDCLRKKRKILVKNIFWDYSGRFFPPPNCFALLRLWSW